MTTALRLPDAFTPGRTSAAAATPTCCCCCCSCAISVVSASVALPSVFNEDVRKQQPTAVSRGRRDTVAMLLAALPWVLVLLPFVLPSRTVNRLCSDGVGSVALIVLVATVTTGFLSAAGGSRTPWRTAGYFLLWTGVAALEFGLILTLLFAVPLLLVTVPAYLVLLSWLPRKIYKRYGPK
jgi:hypothetical protein